MKTNLLKQSVFTMLLVFAASVYINAQGFSINTTGSSADASAMLDVTSTSKGILVPRMTTAQRTAIASPATGLVVYDNTLNQFYYYNGTAWTAIATGGTTNYWTLSGGNLYNNSGTNVGIGITSPLAQLHVSNNIALDNNNANSGTLGSGALTFGFGISGEGIASKRTSGGNQFGLDFYTNNTNRMAITLGGNVGIGTPSPSEKLDVNGKTKTTSFQMTSGAANGYVLQSDAGGNAGWVNANTLTVAETDPQVSSSAANYIPKWNGSTLTDGIIYDDGNNIGIGTSAPAHKLHVQSTGSLSSAFISANAWSSIITASVSGAEAASYYSTYTGGAVSKRWAFGKNDDAETGGNAGSDFFINRYDDNGNYLNRVMNIKRSNGYVAIGGNITPDEQLHVSGKTKTTSFQMTNGAASGFILQSDAGGNASWVSYAGASVVTAGTGLSYSGATLNSVWTASGSNIYSNNSGNAGIGAASPGEKLHVAGNIRIDGGRLDFKNTGGSVFIGELAGQNDDLTVKYNVYAGFYAGRANTTGSQNTGIGAGALENSSTGGNNTAAGRLAGLNLNSGSSNTYLGASSGYSNVNGSSNVFLGYMAGFFETGSNKLYISNSNTASPLIYGDFANKSIQINDSLKTKYFKMTSGAAGGYVLQSDAGGNGAWVSASFLITAGAGLSYSGTTLNSVWTASGSNIYNSNTANVGIGTASPTAKLHASGTGGTTILSEGTSGGAYVEIRSAANNEGAGRFTTSGIARWLMGKSNSAEGGSNTGGDFFINRYDDAGSFLSQPLSITRSSGLVNINGTLNVTAGTIINTVSKTASYTLSSTDYCIVFTGSTAAQTLTFPAPAATGRVIMIINHASVALNTSAYTTASGATAASIAAGASTQLLYDGSVWRKIN